MGNIMIESLDKSYGETDVFQNVNLAVKGGSFTVILGPSGCGKSTLLRIIAGLENVTDGTIKISERDVTHLPGADRDIAMVFQNYALYPHMTAYKNVEYSLKIAGVKKEERKRRVVSALVTVELEDQMDKLPSQMSGGQQQRVALARAIVKQPEVFLMDEPLSNLDAKLRDQMRMTISNLYDRLNTTFLFVTHDQNEAMSLADNIILLNEGKVMQEGSPKDLYTNPRNRFVAEFIGSPEMNIIEMENYDIGFRAEDIQLDKKNENYFSLHVSINHSEPRSNERIYNLKSDYGDLHYLTQNTWEDDASIDTIHIPLEKLYFFEKEGDGKRLAEGIVNVKDFQTVKELRRSV